MIAVLVNNFGSQMAEGFLHQFEGWIIFLLGTFLIGIEILALERFRLRRIEIVSVLNRPKGSTHNVITLNESALATVVACAVALAVVISINWADAYASKPIRQSFAAFPTQIDDWFGRRQELAPEVQGVLKSTDSYLADFSRAASRTPVNLFVAYYDSLSKGAAIHSPRVCLPGSGWEFTSFEEASFADLVAGMTGTVNRVIIQKGEQKILMYYWFQQRERRTANEFSMKYYLLADNLRKNRKDGALIRIYTPILGVASGEADAEQRLKSFAQGLLSRIAAYVPAD